MTIDLKTNKWISFFFIIAFTVIIFYLIFQRIDINDVISTLLDANIFYIFLSVIPLGISLFFNALRWQSVLRATGYHVELKECFIVFMAAIPFSSITPSKSGDVIRAYYLKKKIPIAQTVGTVITERIFDLAVLIIMSLIGVYFWGMYDFTFIIFLILVLLGIFIIITCSVAKLPIPDPWKQKIQNFFISMKKLVESRRDLLLVIFFSLCIWILAILQTILLFSALSITIPLFYLVGTLPIAIVIGMIPVTLGGMGTRDTAFVILFSSYATSGELLAIALLFSLFRYWFLAIIGLPFMKIAINNS